MSIALYSITSSLHTETEEDVRNEQFIKDVEAALGCAFESKGNDFSDYGTHDRDIIYVRTGGTEGVFKRLDPQGDIKILTSGKSNSLAASMEILSWLRQNGRKGEIIHGTPEYIASRILAGPCCCSSQAGEPAVSPFVKPAPVIDLGGKRLGVIGKPSDWLISSDVDYPKALARLGVELVDIPISEVIEGVKAKGIDSSTFAGSEAVYEVVKGIVEKYGLGGVTLRCFDLLDTIHNTGCLALAKLNAEGIPSSCEGDIPTLLTMMIANAQTGHSGFQCNLSRISGDELLFAHCTVPLDMVTSYRYDTHFESGIGTAIKGELPLGPVRIMKISPDLEKIVEIPAEIVNNQYEQWLCRTQIVVKAPGAADYFLRTPHANHHVIVW